MTAPDEQVALVRTIGERMKQARELCNMSQMAAARHLGYNNPSKLSKIENASDTTSVPILTIVRAAMLYQVSCDYLFGLSDAPDIGMIVNAETAGYLHAVWDELRQRDVRAIEMLNEKIKAMESAIATMLSESHSVDEAMQAFIGADPGFDDRRGGARLVASIERNRQLANLTRKKMDGFRAELRRRDVSIAGIPGINYAKVLELSV